MPKYKGFQALYMSFFSADLYRDVAQNWRGVGYLYLFLTFTCVWLILSVLVQFECNRFIQANSQVVVEKWPTLTLKDGKATIDKESPYIIQSNDLTVVFDMGNHPTFPENKQGVLVTATDARSHDSKGEEKPILDFSKQSDNVVDQKTIQQWINSVKVFVGIVLVVAGAFVFPWILIQGLIYAGIGCVAASAMNVKLEFAQVLRITSVAFTPALLLDVIIHACMLKPFWALWIVVWIALVVGYVIFGVRVNKEAPATEATV